MDLHGIWIPECESDVFTFHRYNGGTIRLSKTQHFPTKECASPENDSVSHDILWFCSVYELVAGI